MPSRLLDANRIRIHAVEEGEGPLVLFVHGFPESWFSWRHQLKAVSAAGYRAVAIDVRGYGRSSKPTAVDAYRMLAHVADNVATVAALGERQAVIVGHDWGSPIAAASALLRPDVFRAAGLLSVPYSPPGGNRPTESFRAMGGDEEFYINYFQQPGRAEAEIEADVRSWLLGFYVSASAEGQPGADGGSMATLRPGGLLKDRFTTLDHFPAWLPEADFEVYVAEFERSGFAGPLNRYRNVDRDWEDLQPWAGQPIRVPALFIGGDRDGPTLWGAKAIERYSETLPALVGSHILSDCGHWTQQERADDVNALLVDFLRRIA